MMPERLAPVNHTASVCHLPARQGFDVPALTSLPSLGSGTIRNNKRPRPGAQCEGSMTDEQSGIGGPSLEFG
jgi:hypothetical protein